MIERLHSIIACFFCVIAAENFNNQDGVRMELPGWVEKSGGPYSAINIILFLSILLILIFVIDKSVQVIFSLFKKKAIFFPKIKLVYLVSAQVLFLSSLISSVIILNSSYRNFFNYINTPNALSDHDLISAVRFVFEDIHFDARAIFLALASSGLLLLLSSLSFLKKEKKEAIGEKKSD